MNYYFYLKNGRMFLYARVLLYPMANSDARQGPAPTLPQPIECIVVDRLRLIEGELGKDPLGVQPRPIGAMVSAIDYILHNDAALKRWFPEGAWDEIAGCAPNGSVAGYLREQPCVQRWYGALTAGSVESRALAA